MMSIDWIIFICFFLMSGRFTRNIRDYELLVPHKVDQNGNFLSFHLPQFFKHNFAAHRLKRDFSHHDAAHYNLFFDGKDHVIEMLPNQGLVAPKLINEYHYKDSDKTLNARRTDASLPVLCHYTGRVRSINGSRVAISTCDGLVS